MKTAWVILILSAITDAIITGGTAFTTVIAETKALPSQESIWVIGVGATVAFARTIQQALKAAQAPETVENLRHEPKK
jgi:hypothetical protein